MGKKLVKRRKWIKKRLDQIVLMKFSRFWSDNVWGFGNRYPINCF
jgi:hypothetical protein